MPSLYDMISGQAGGQPVPRSQEQQGWKQQAQQQSLNMNAMPFVLDPNKLTSDPTANHNTMYPALQQPGGVSQIFAGGKNIAPGLTQQGLDTSKIGQVPSIDDLAALVSQKTGQSLEDSKAWVITQLGSSASAGGPTAPTMNGGGAPGDTAGMYQRGPSDY